MHSYDADAVDPAETTIIRIKDHGVIEESAYDGAVSAHAGSLWWGTAIGYRAMHAAAEALPKDSFSSRDNLYIVGAHPRPGMRDAIDFVTHAVECDRYRVVADTDCSAKCNSSMKFDWWVSDGRRTAFLKLHDDFVPHVFYELSDRLGTPAETKDDMWLFEIFKFTLSARIWAVPLSCH